MEETIKLLLRAKILHEQGTHFIKNVGWRTSEIVARALSNNNTEKDGPCAASNPLERAYESQLP